MTESQEGIAVARGNVSPRTMDEVLARHFEAEANHDMDGILATLTEDCEHDVVGWPTGVSRGHGELKGFYERLFADFQEHTVTPLRRYHAENLLVDESLYVGTATGTPFGLEGRGREVTFRILHVCEFSDQGLISRENVWLDLAAIFQQLAP